MENQPFGQVFSEETATWLLKELPSKAEFACVVDGVECQGVALAMLSKPVRHEGKTLHRFRLHVGLTPKAAIDPSVRGEADAEDDSDWIDELDGPELTSTLGCLFDEAVNKLRRQPAFSALSEARQLDAAAGAPTALGGSARKL